MRRLNVALGLAVALLAAGCNSRASTPPRSPLIVRAQKVEIEDYSSRVALTGTVQAQVQTDLSFRVSGRVVARNADVGQHVEAGAVLARIDPAEQQADLDSANAAVTAAEAVLRQASAAFDRQKALFEQGYATRSAFDSAQQNLRTAQATLDAAKAQAASATDALSYSELKTDVAGVVTARNIEVGQVAQAAQAAFTLAQDGPRDAVFNVYEAIFLLKPAGGAIELSLVADPKIRAIGHVREVAPAVDARTGTVRVKVSIVDPPAGMTLGSPVTGSGRFSPTRVVILPWSAATTKDGALAVWVIDPSTKAVSLRKVGAEAFEREKLVVRDGLQPGDVVVTEGGKFLFPGEVVEIAQATP